MQTRAYWQTRELVDERNDDGDNWTDLWEQYGNLDHRLMEVDHIKRIADGGRPLEESNFQSLCTYCYEAKTADENSTTTRETAPDVTLTGYLES